MTLKVIGAGMGRTGTMSLKLALEQLGFGPCFHMAEFFRNDDPDTLMSKWSKVAFGPGAPDWDDVFDGYPATVDFPAAVYWKDLSQHYPKAKVILTERDPERWFDSTQKTIFRPNPDEPLEERTDPWALMVLKIIGDDTFGGNTRDRDHCIAVFERHNAAVKAALPPERLLVYEVKQGWEPLCAFLGVPVPDTPFPSENSTDAFKARPQSAVQGVNKTG